MKPPREIISDAIIKLLMCDPFWACLIVRLQVLMTKRLVPSVGTDGKYLVVNPDWVERKPFEEVVVVIVHEAVHIALKHIFRRGKRDFDRWNRACDHVVNLMIRKKTDPYSGRVLHGYDIPKTWLCDPRFEGMSAEQVYEIIEREETQKAQPPPPPPESDQDQNDSSDEDGEAGQDQDQDQEQDDQEDQSEESEEEESEGEGEGEDEAKGQDGTDSTDDNDGTFDPDMEPAKPRADRLDMIFDFPAESSEDSKAAEEMLDVTIQAAYETAKAAGNAPGYFAMEVEARSKHVIDYTELLRDWLAKNVFAQDYDWMVADRRFVGTGFHIPALADGDGEAKVLLICDVSGSMLNDRDMPKTAAEVQGVLEEFPGKYYVLYTDTEYKGIQEITPEEPFKLRFEGGGGTDFGAIMEHVRNESQIVFEAILFFTDMETCSFGRDPEKPVLWMSTSQVYQKPPFGKVIEIRDCLFLNARFLEIEDSVRYNLKKRPTSNPTQMEAKECRSARLSITKS